MPRHPALATVALFVALAATTRIASAQAADPTKERALADLRTLCAALEAGDLDKAVTFLANPPGGTPAELKAAAKRMLEAQEISRDGIDVIERDGKWGRLAEVKPKKGAEWAAKYKVPIAQCWAIEHADGAEAVFHFDGRMLKLIRCDDIGKLQK